jgi:hypothetical protein
MPTAHSGLRKSVASKTVPTIGAVASICKRAGVRGRVPECVQRASIASMRRRECGRVRVRAEVRVQRRVLARVGENAASDCERVRSRSCARVGRCSRGAHNGICDSGQNDEQRGRHDARGKRDRARVRRVALGKRSQASGQTWPVPAQFWTRPGWRRRAWCKVRRTAVALRYS